MRSVTALSGVRSLKGLKGFYTIPEFTIGGTYWYAPSGATIAFIQLNEGRFGDSPDEFDGSGRIKVEDKSDHSGVEGETCELGIEFQGTRTD